MEHYVVVHDWASDELFAEGGVNIIGVAHSLEEAKVIFNTKVAEEREIATENEWEIYEDTDVMFDAGEDGYYLAAHTKLYIQGVS